MQAWLRTFDHATGAAAKALALTGGLVLIALAVMVLLSILGGLLGARGLGISAFGPISGQVELVEMGCAFAVTTFLPWCHRMRRHIGVDLILCDETRRSGRIARLVSDALMLAAALLIAWGLVGGFRDRLSSGESSFILAIPLSLAYGACLIGIALFVLQALLSMIQGQSGVQNKSKGRSKP